MVRQVDGGPEGVVCKAGTMELVRMTATEVKVRVWLCAAVTA